MRYCLTGNVECEDVEFLDLVCGKVCGDVKHGDVVCGELGCDDVGCWDVGSGYLRCVDVVFDDMHV
jgi:hypothetical protein